ncbi:hypothetical protein FTUN_4978 [Frigoriglobus tundricola]|uniref:Uncharacterized protein n=1 Tax=Frigoriglobus tundricola TaxID=2774151 RepID=A0A6M5YVA4_9BACT|nr:hypothetical protein FTUN_4978 [Frigoriglobus tundricola]
MSADGAHKSPGRCPGLIVSTRLRIAPHSPAVLNRYAFPSRRPSRPVDPCEVTRCPTRPR